MPRAWCSRPPIAQQALTASARPWMSCALLAASWSSSALSKNQPNAIANELHHGPIVWITRSWRSLCHENVNQPNCHFLAGYHLFNVCFCRRLQRREGTLAGEPFDKIIKPARRNIPGSDKQIVGRVLASERGLASKPAAAGSVAGADVPERAPAPANLGSYDVLGRWP